MNITIINDCKDSNATGRQIARVSSLLGGNVSFIGVSSDLEASGNIVDALDSYGDLPGVILANVAPRNGRAKKWKNGTPFGYFWYKKVLVISSIDGFTLSLVKKLGLTKTINILDIPTVLNRLVLKKIIPPNLKNYIADTQFRSYDFLPRIAAYLLKNKNITCRKAKTKVFPDAPFAVWWIDNFGNCKTTIFKREISQHKLVITKFGKIKYFEKLKDVPDKTTALITGSSGLGNERFLEIVIQGKSAAKFLNLFSGDSVF